MMLKPRVGFYAVYEPPEEGWEDWEESFRQVARGLQNQGLEIISAPEPVKDPASCKRVGVWAAAQDLDLLHALIITWSLDHYTIRIQQQTGLPVAIRSFPGIRTGSLVGGEQLSCILADLDAEHRLFFGPLPSAEVAAQTAIYARACAIHRRLQGAQIAVIGRRTEGMTPTAVDEVEILRLFGVRLLNYGLDEFNDLAQQVSPALAQETWQKLASGARAVTARPEDGLASAQRYLALKGMIRELGLQAISIGSYPQCQGTMCVPIALLNDEGFPTGCEGDINSTIALFILSCLSEEALHFGEMLDVDETANAITTSHCGCGSPSLAGEEGYILCPVRLANNGVCVRFAARPGPVTYVNLVGRKGNYRMCAFQGQAVPTGLVFEGNPLRFVLDTPFRKIWNEVARHGFGHHWMTCYAHVVPELNEFCRISGLQGVFPDLKETA